MLIYVTTFSSADPRIFEKKMIIFLGSQLKRSWPRKRGNYFFLSRLTMILLKNRSFEPFLIDGPLKLRSKRADLRLVDLYYLTFLFTSPSTKTCSSSKKHNPSCRKVHFHRFVAIISSNGNIEHRYLRLTCTVQKFFNFLSWSQPIIMSIADFFRG